MKNNPVEKELNAIRADFYEKTKDMSSSKKVEYIKAQTADIHDKFGITTITGTRPHTSGKIAI